MSILNRPGIKFYSTLNPETPTLLAILAHVFGTWYQVTTTSAQQARTQGYAQLWITPQNQTRSWVLTAPPKFIHLIRAVLNIERIENPKLNLDYSVGVSTTDGEEPTFTIQPHAKTDQHCVLNVRYTLSGKRLQGYASGYIGGAIFQTVNDAALYLAQWEFPLPLRANEKTGVSAILDGSTWGFPETLDRLPIVLPDNCTVQKIHLDYQVQSANTSAITGSALYATVQALYSDDLLDPATEVNPLITRADKM